MTNEQILDFAQSMNYAHVVVDSSCRIGYGCTKWKQAVQRLSTEQREKLVGKIEHWHEIVEREVAS